MTKTVFFLTAAVMLLVAVWDVKSVDGLSCSSCAAVRCSYPTDCKYGTGRWGCLCCDVCLLGPGEPCGGPWNLLGVCGTGLKCLKIKSIDFNGVCVFERFVKPVLGAAIEPAG